VVVHANRDLEAAQSLAREIGGKAVAFDVTDGAATLAALEAILEDGAIQVLVNNAGIHDDAPFPACARSNGRA
jgi:3-oxoacyl-[acyl-carrier protein] reductase